MKSYRSKAKDNKKNFFVRHKYAVAVTVSAIVIAAAVVLAVVFTLPKKKPDSGVVKPPVDVVTPPTVISPMSAATVGKSYADDKLVFWETLELYKWHPAVDFVGEGDVVAMRDGTVADVEKTSLEGYVVTVTHDDGYTSIYKSLGSDVAVKKGDAVKAGDKLGVASASMMTEVDTGAHLHFELKKDGKYIDPATVLPIEEEK